MDTKIQSNLALEIASKAIVIATLQVQIEELQTIIADYEKKEKSQLEYISKLETENKRLSSELEDVTVEEVSE